MPTVETTETESFLEGLFRFLDDEEVQATGVEDREGFKIDSTDQANYFARKLQEVRLEKQDAVTTAKLQIEAYQERVDKWLSKVTKPLEYEEQRLLTMLEQFAVERLEGSTKKSIKLIEGTLQFKKPQPKYEYEEETLLTHVKTKFPEYTASKTTVTVDKAALKKAVSIKDGKAYLGKEEVKGVTVSQAPDTFDVK